MSDVDRGRDSDSAGSTPYVSDVAADESISRAVVDAVAAVSGRSAFPAPDRPGSEDGGIDPLDPLHEVVNPDALEALCRPRHDDPREATTIMFTYCGYEVTVESTGRITVTGN